MLEPTAEPPVTALELGVGFELLPASAYVPLLPEAVV